MKRRKKWRSNLIVAVSWTGKLDFACSSIDSTGPRVKAAGS
jgi:hypothetical protein